MTGCVLISEDLDGAIVPLTVIYVVINMSQFFMCSKTALLLEKSGEVCYLLGADLIFLLEIFMIGYILWKMIP